VFYWQAIIMFQLKLITILGATSSGKSSAAVEIAKSLGNTVIVGCDSRQVYKEFNLGTGKVPGKWVTTDKQFTNFSKKFDTLFCYENIPHFLIDCIPVQSTYSVKNFIEDFDILITKLSTVKNLEYVILVGGTGYYAQAVLEGWRFESDLQGSIDQQLAPWQLRSLYYTSVLTKNTRILNQSDLYNPRRLLSYLNPPIDKKNINPLLNNLGVFALSCSKEYLVSVVAKRLYDRLEEGLFEEFYQLYLRNGAVINSRAIEYQVLEFYLFGWINEKQRDNLIITKTLQYAKRQLTWLTQIKDIQLVEGYRTILSAIKVTPSDIIDGLNTTIHNSVTDNT
jgi:tRNA dimethylallyltransferase